MKYDVIVIGNTPVGRYAALMAVLWEARVALVTQEISFCAEANWLYHFTLGQLTQIAESWGNIQPLETLPIATYRQWTQEVIEIVQEETALVKLAAQGVDVIEGKGEFSRLPQQAFVVKQEMLRARGYLIATETIPMFPDLPNLSQMGYLTVSDLRKKQDLANLPQNLTIVGDCPSAVTLAQNLARLKKNITLAIKKSRLFSTEDQTISYLLQAQLEADGIHLLKSSPLSDCKEIETEKWLQLGKHAIKTDQLIIVPETAPYLEGLNLEGVNVKSRKHSLILNEKLRTTNPKIYACGSVIGGYSFLNLGQYEAKIALKNILFFPRHTVNYQDIPCLMSTHPPLARVGMTEAQAKRAFGEKVVVIEEYFKTNLLSIVQSETTGLLKIIVYQNGEILGGHILGKNADSLVSLIAIAMAKKIKMKQLATVSFPAPSISELISKAVQQWDDWYYQTHPLWRELRKRYFLIRRNWMR
ncbi:MAG: FAD-dependent oxidoreductase [Cyanobacteria bacterium]|jgi:pyruvate/2-oxoglutarate dehydrogenase complex dihydrolipoamide dehydrogenase (E3) component|nr:FAD-dependent oxidoreductase [Cyanobacteria bacterium GSL.Bin1]